MSPSRIWTLGGTAAIVAILGGTFGLAVQPSLSAAAAADTSAAQVQQANDGTAIELARLARVAAKQSELEQQNAFVGRAITGSLRWNTFSKQIRDTASSDGVEITTLASGDPVDYVAPAPAAAPAAASSGSAPAASASPAPAASSAPTPAPVVGAAAQGIFGKTDPLITGSNLVAIPVTVTITGNEESSVGFAQDVQHMTRLFAVNNVTYSKSADASTPSATTISGTIYALRG
jgi:Tfp pilus assembly protein PilO